MARRRVVDQDGWTLRRTPFSQPGRRGRRTAVDRPAIPDAFLQSSAVRVDQVFEAQPPADGARRAAPPDLVIDVDLNPGEESLLAIRHPSGALTFHPSTERVTRPRRRGTAGATARFRVPIRRVAQTEGRRGMVSKAVRVVVLKVARVAVDKAIGIALPKLAAAWEKRIWSERGLEEGWFKVTRAGG